MTLLRRAAPGSADPQASNRSGGELPPLTAVASQQAGHSGCVAFLAVSATTRANAPDSTGFRR